LQFGLCSLGAHENCCRWLRRGRKLLRRKADSSRCRRAFPSPFGLRGSAAAGVCIKSVAGDFSVHPNCSWKPEDIGVSDLVLIALKTTANGQFARLLPPLAGPATILLTLQNGLGNEEQIAALFSPSQVMGGLCFVCLNRVEPGVIQHTDHGQIVLGEFQGGPGARTKTIAELFNKGGVPCAITGDLARTHWEKLTWNIPFNGLGVAGAAGYDAVVAGAWTPGSPQWPLLAYQRTPGWWPLEALIRI